MANFRDINKFVSQIIEEELEEFDEETTRYTLEDCPYSFAELSSDEIRFGTTDGIIDYLRLKGEL